MTGFSREELAEIVKTSMKEWLDEKFAPDFSKYPETPADKLQAGLLRDILSKVESNTARLDAIEKDLDE